MIAVIDTCVIIDALQNRQPFCEDAKRIFLLAAEEKIKGLITAKSVSDIYYITHKLTHSDSQTREILMKLFSLFQVVDTTQNDCYNAISSKVSDYEDAIMIETSKRIKADCIITRNIRDYTQSPVPIYSPEKFLLP